MRIPLIVSSLAILLIAACGGDSDKDGEPTQATAGSPTSEVQAQPTKDNPAATPRPAADTDLVVQVVSQGKVYQPTLAEFRSLPQVEVQANGTKKGVSLATLAEKVGAPGTGSVQVEGQRPDLVRAAIIRYSTQEVAATTVLVIGDDGRLSLFSSSIPEAEWLKFVDGVAFV